jgi:hypothetical protein
MRRSHRQPNRSEHGHELNIQEKEKRSRIECCDRENNESAKSDQSQSLRGR